MNSVVLVLSLKVVKTTKCFRFIIHLGIRYLVTNYPSTHAVLIAYNIMHTLECIFLHYSYALVKKKKDARMGLCIFYLHIYIIPILFAYFWLAIPTSLYVQYYKWFVQ